MSTVRQSLRTSRASVPNGLLDDPIVAELITENEMMLMEIEFLRSQNETLTSEVAQLKSAREADAVVHKKETEDEVERARADMQLTMENKVAMLRTILNSLTQFQFEMEYFHSERVIRPDENAQGDDDEKQQHRRPSAASRPQRLADVNQRYEQLYHLISSYQRTPSFASNPYDALVLDSLNQIVALNKTLNAVTFARVEMESAAEASNDTEK